MCVDTLHNLHVSACQYSAKFQVDRKEGWGEDGKGGLT